MTWIRTRRKNKGNDAEQRKMTWVRKDEENEEDKDKGKDQVN